MRLMWLAHDKHRLASRLVLIAALVAPMAAQEVTMPVLDLTKPAPSEQQVTGVAGASIGGIEGQPPPSGYPAVHELYVLGDAAESALVTFIGTNKSSTRTELDNALYTLLLIHHGDALAVIQELHKESANSASMETRDRLQDAAKDGLKWCDERWRSKCEDALK